MLVRAHGEGQASVVGPHSLLKESFRRGNITLGREPELDCLTRRIDGAGQVLPLCAHLDECLVETVSGAAHHQVWAHPPVDLSRVLLHPSKNQVV